MELKASTLKEGKRFSVAYHPDGDGYGAVNIFMNHLPDATFRLYSVDNAKRDFTQKQFDAILQDIKEDFWVVYLDLSPSNPVQLEELCQKTKFFYIDHHQIHPDFEKLFDKVQAHNPRIYDTENANAYAAGLQVYHLFDNHQADLPYLFVSLFGDAKFSHWPEFKDQLSAQQDKLAKMADAISYVGLTQQVGPYAPERTDALFNEVIEKTRAAYEQTQGSQEEKTDALLAAFEQTKIYQQYQVLSQKIQVGYQVVKEQIEKQNRLIEISDDQYMLSAILLKEAYKELDFEGPYIIYQVDELSNKVLYAAMAKNSDYDCAGTIRQSPYLAGGGHTDRAGATGPAEQLKQALEFFDVQ